VNDDEQSLYGVENWLLLLTPFYRLHEANEVLDKYVNAVR